MRNEHMVYDEKIDAQIALFKAKADRARAATRIHATKGNRAARHGRNEIWQGLKTGAVAAWDDVRSAFHVAATKFR